RATIESSAVVLSRAGRRIASGLNPYVWAKRGISVNRGSLAHQSRAILQHTSNGMRHLGGDPPAVMNQPRITELGLHAVSSIFSCNSPGVIAHAVKVDRAGMDIERCVLRPVVRATRMADAARVDEMKLVVIEPHAVSIQ